MKSPHLQNLDSPDLSDASSSSDEEDQGGVPTDTSASVVDVTAGTSDLTLDREKEHAKPDSMSYVNSLVKGEAATPRTSSDARDQPSSEPVSPMGHSGP